MNVGDLKAHEDAATKLPANFADLDARYRAEDWRERDEFYKSRLGVARVALEMTEYADAAVAFLIHAEFELDSARQERYQRVADTCATLALRDAVVEATATLKASANRQVDSTTELLAKLGEVT